MQECLFQCEPVGFVMLWWFFLMIPPKEGWAVTERVTVKVTEGTPAYPKSRCWAGIQTQNPIMLGDSTVALVVFKKTSSPDCLAWRVKSKT